MKLVILGLSITSSWGNGHATTYRSLVRALHERGHEVLFLERDMPWYAQNRDLPKPPYGTTCLYQSLAALKRRHTAAVRSADAVIVGSYVPEGRELGEWVLRTAGGVTAFYDIDTPITLAALMNDKADYVTRAQVRRYDVYLSFTGGPTLERIEREFGARAARALYCSVDPRSYYPKEATRRWSMGYLGTYSADRQPTLDALLLHTARARSNLRFVVAGPQYPADIVWPENVQRTEHLAPHAHRLFYARQRFTLNVTRAEMIRAGYSPSVRLFEAAACGTPIISDAWAGLESVLTPGQEVLVAHDSSDVLRYLDMAEKDRELIGTRARTRILREHTSEHRAAELEAHIQAVRNGSMPEVRGVQRRRGACVAQ